MTDEQLEAIRQRWAAADPEPDWPGLARAFDPQRLRGLELVTPGGNTWIVNPLARFSAEDLDAIARGEPTVVAFAHAQADITALLEEVGRLRAALAADQP